MGHFLGNEDVRAGMLGVLEHLHQPLLLLECQSSLSLMWARLQGSMNKARN